MSRWILKVDGKTASDTRDFVWSSRVLTNSQLRQEVSSKALGAVTE